ncbi:hypothetical protein F5Y14DRAFT_406106 [Nemania sp. NC0429]|nr:hypothetical protein F5Y14DRAFT_406106 [Nemania sp. NC0429]
MGGERGGENKSCWICWLAGWLPGWPVGLVFCYCFFFVYRSNDAKMSTRCLQVFFFNCFNCLFICLSARFIHFAKI